MSRFVMFFFIEDSAIRFSSCPFALELYYSLHSFCIFLERVNFFFFFCLHFHTLPVFFFFSIMFYAPLKNKQKKKPPRKAVLFHEYQASTGRSNKFVSLLAASVCFFYDHCIRVCVFACASFYYRLPILRKRILVLLKTSRSITRSVRLCISSHLKLRRPNDYKCILKPNGNKCEAWLCFSTKLEKCMKSCVSLLFYSSKLWRCWNSYSNLPGSLSGAHWPTCACECVFVHNAASSDCNVGGVVAWWLALLRPETFLFSGIPQTSRWRLTEQSCLSAMLRYTQANNIVSFLKGRQD